MVKLSLPLVGILVALASRVLNTLETFKDVEKLPVFQKSQDQCRPLGETAKIAPSCEDFRFVSDNIILSGVGSITAYLDIGSKSPAVKHMIAIDLTTETHKFIDLEGYPFDKFQFRPHGLEYRAPDRLFVTSHSDGGVERVEVFAISGQTSVDTLKLKWLTAVTPPVPNSALNSVTAVSSNEIYVTHWLQFSVPPGGLHHPQGLGEIATVLKGFGEFFAFRILGLPPLVGGNTAIYRCLVDSNKCEKMQGGFISSNGITSTPDGKYVFAVDCVRQFLAVFTRDASNGNLTLLKTTELVHAPDNVMIKPLSDGKYELWIGTMPLLLKYLAEKKPIPGGLLVVTFDPKDASLTSTDVFIEDGRKLDGVATAAKWGSKVLLSGPKKSGGILVCDVNKA